MKKLVFLSTISILLLTACSKNYYSHRSINIDKNNLITTPVVTDISVDITKKVTARSGERKTIAQAKDEAYYNAIVNNNIDVVVDPIYNITEKPTLLFFRRRAVVEITGFSGKYTNVRNVTDAVKTYNMDTSYVNNFMKLNSMDIKSKNAGNFDQPMDPKKKGIVALILALFFGPSILNFLIGVI